MKLPVLTLDSPNLNGRIYPREIVEKALKDYTETHVSQKRALIVNQAPETSTVNLHDVVGIVNNISIEENTVMVDVKFLPDLKNASIIESNIKSGKLHVRMSGDGSVQKDKNGNHVVQPNYKINTCFVTDKPA